MIYDLVNLIHEYCGFDIEYARFFFKSKQHETVLFSNIMITLSLTDAYLFSGLNEAFIELFSKQKTVLSSERMYKYFNKFIDHTGITVSFTKFTKFINLHICRKCFDKELHTRHTHKDELIELLYYNVILNKQPTINDLDNILKYKY